MKTATVTELKKELNFQSQQELIELCLQLSKFKKENKELLTYLLYESSNEQGYIQSVKDEIEQLYSEINTRNYYFIKKSIRKILKRVKTYIRYSKKKETEIELLIHFLQQMKKVSPSIKYNTTLQNLFNRQVVSINKSMEKIHEDLQYDFQIELDNL